MSSQTNISDTPFNQKFPGHPEVCILRWHRHTDRQTNSCRHERESLFAFWDGNGKTGKAFPVFRMGTEYTKNHSRSLEREWEIQETIPIVRDGIGKTRISFTLNGTGTGNLKVLYMYTVFFKNVVIFFTSLIFAP